jgi:hypothetical protein
MLGGGNIFWIFLKVNDDLFITGTSEGIAYAWNYKFDLQKKYKEHLNHIGSLLLLN